MLLFEEATGERAWHTVPPPQAHVSCWLGPPSTLHRNYGGQAGAVRCLVIQKLVLRSQLLNVVFRPRADTRVVVLFGASIGSGAGRRAGASCLVTDAHVHVVRLPPSPYLLAYLVVHTPGDVEREAVPVLHRLVPVLVKSCRCRPSFSFGDIRSPPPLSLSALLDAVWLWCWFNLEVQAQLPPEKICTILCMI